MNSPDWSSWLGLISVCVLIAIIGGPVAGVVPVFGYVAYRWPTKYGVLAFAAMVAAGALTAAAAHPAAGSGAFGAPAQAFALTALAAALMPAWPAQEGRTRRWWRGRT